MKKTIVGVMLALLMVFGGNTVVHAHEGVTVQGVLDEIQQVAETEEEFEQEIKGLTVNELEEIYEYLTNKPNLSEEYQLILTLTQDVVYGGETFQHKVETAMSKEEERAKIKAEADEFVKDLTREEKNALDKELRLKEGEDQTLEDESLRNAVRQSIIISILKPTMYVALGTIVLGIIVKIYDKKTNKLEMYDRFTFVAIYAGLACLAIFGLVYLAVIL